VIAKAGSNERRINVQVLEREAKEVPIDFGEAAPPQNNANNASNNTSNNTSTSTSTSTSTTSDAPHKSPWLAVGITGLAVGGVGLAIGAVTGTMSLSQTNDIIKNSCGGTSTCPASAQPAIADARTLATVSDVGFIAGGVIAAAGLVFIVVAATSKSPTTSAELRLGPGSLMLSGRF